MEEGPTAVAGTEVVGVISGVVARLCGVRVEISLGLLGDGDGVLVLVFGRHLGRFDVGRSWRLISFRCR